MGFSFKATFNKENRKNKTGIYTVYLRVTIDGVSTYLNTGEKLHEKYWKGDPEQWVKPTYPFAFELNALINKKIDLLRKYQYRQKLYDNPVTMQGIIETFNRKSDLTLFNDYVAEYRKNVKGKADNTLKKYDTFIAYLNEFNPKISFGHLNESLFQAFASFLQDKKNQMGVTVLKYFDPFKVIVKEAVRDGYLEKNPFTYARLEIKATRGKRVYLDLDEITRIKNCEIAADRADLEEVRRHWMFCFYCAFYYSDLVRLRWTDIKDSPSGPCIIGTRYKNSEAFIAPIHKFEGALAILEMQRGKDPDYVFPGAITEQRYNKKLKDLAVCAKIKKNLMNKTSRHSAIQFWEAQGLETQHTAKMAGHTKESTTKQYFEISATDINNRVARFDFSSLDI
jgi:integrase